jgi:hypothetical protein
MASYHLSAKIGKSGSGAKHAAYISRDGKYAAKDDCEELLNGNMPIWAKSPSEFWEQADKSERANGSVYREFEVALPRELTPAERLDLVREFITAELSDKHTYTVAIHNPRAAIEGGEQPHAHIMYSERLLDGIERPAEQHFKRYNSKAPEKGGCQKASGGKTKEENVAALQASRERWASLQNKHLAKAGHATTVDHRSLADQGIGRLPEAHIGPKRRDLLAALRQQRAAQKMRPARKETGLTLDHAKVVVQAREQGQLGKAANLVNAFVRVGIYDQRWDLSKLEHLQELIDTQTSRPGTGETLVKEIRAANAQQRAQAKGMER